MIFYLKSLVHREAGFSGGDNKLTLQLIEKGGLETNSVKIHEFTYNHSRGGAAKHVLYCKC